MVKRVQGGAIVVPWNFSATSRAALERAIEIAVEGQPIRVLHVAAPLTGPDCGVLYEYAEKQKAAELERQFRNQLSMEARKPLKFYVSFGKIDHEIARFASRFQAEAIVIGSRPRKGISKLLFGGLPESVIQLADCPVHHLRHEETTSVAILKASSI